MKRKLKMSSSNTKRDTHFLISSLVAIRCYSVLVLLLGYPINRSKIGNKLVTVQIIIKESAQVKLDISGNSLRIFYMILMKINKEIAKFERRS